MLYAGVNFGIVLITLFAQAGEYRVTGCAKFLPQFAVDADGCHADFFPVALNSLGFVDGLLQVLQF